MRKLILVGAVLSLLTACGGGTTPPVEVQPPAPTLPLRPAGTPDYFVLSISGKCFRTTDALLPYIPNCADLWPSSIQPLDTTNNYDYLTQKGTTQAIASAIAGKGWKVGYKGYAASLYDRNNDSSGTTKVSPGFLTFVKDVSDIYETTIKGFSNPSKIIIVAHSHGVVWSHLFTKINYSVPVEMQVDFDGVCLYWVADNKGDFAAEGLDKDIDFSSICNGPRVLLGGDKTDLQNITYDNVKVNIEVQSSGTLANRLFDSVDNLRTDGRNTNIYSIKFPEDHSGVTKVGSAGLAYAIRQIQNFTPQR